jgi:hypothetical protein
MKQPRSAPEGSAPSAPVSTASSKLLPPGLRGNAIAEALQKMGIPVTRSSYLAAGWGLYSERGLHPEVMAELNSLFPPE